MEVGFKSRSAYQLKVKQWIKKWSFRRFGSRARCNELERSKYVVEYTDSSLSLNVNRRALLQWYNDLDTVSTFRYLNLISIFNDYKFDEKKQIKSKSFNVNISASVPKCSLATFSSRLGKWVRMAKRSTLDSRKRRCTTTLTNCAEKMDGNREDAEANRPKLPPTTRTLT